MKELTHAMIDLETLALVPTTRIISIGVVLFDPRINKVGDTLYIELNHKSQTTRTKDPDTVKWWKKQSKEAKKALHGIVTLEDALEELAFFIPKGCKVWGNGSIFDIAILENAYRELDIEIPWEFYDILDMRTIKYFYESCRGGFGKNPTGTVHNALDDAYYQAASVSKMWQRLIKQMK